MTRQRYNRYTDPQSCHVEGNNGGSYVRLVESNKPGHCLLEVGESCVTTIDEEIPVALLACVLTVCKDEGFLAVLHRYSNGGYNAEWQQKAFNT